MALTPVTFETVYKAKSVEADTAGSNSNIGTPSALNTVGTVGVGGKLGQEVTYFVKYATEVPKLGLPILPGSTVKAAKLQFKVSSTAVVDGPVGAFRVAILRRASPARAWQSVIDFTSAFYPNSSNLPHVTLGTRSDVVIADTRQNDTWLTNPGAFSDYTFYDGNAGGFVAESVVTMSEGYGIVATPVNIQLNNLVSELQDYFDNSGWDPTVANQDYIGFCIDPALVATVQENFGMYHDNHPTQPGLELSVLWETLVEVADGCVKATTQGYSSSAGFENSFESISGDVIPRSTVDGRGGLEPSTTAKVELGSAMGATPKGGC